MGFMPPNLISRLRACGRPAVVIATMLMVVQAFCAGLAGAQAALVTGAGTGAGDIGVICHGHGGAPSDGSTAPDAPDQQHPCCAFCTAGAGAAVLPAPPLALVAGGYRPVRLLVLRAVSILIAPRAVRAGASQAPPASV
jgi:hypothetical protein